jgi:hypothetical protein
MSTTRTHLGDLLHRSRGAAPGSDAVVGNLDMKFEVASSPCPMSTEPRSSTNAWVGGSTPMMPRWTVFASCSSRRRGSGASVTFGKGITAAAPGSAEAGLVVSDIEAAHDQLARRGIDVSDVWHGPPFPVEARQPGRDPERTSYGSFCSFSDPDGNTWLVQEVTTRLPGRM